MGHAEAVSGIAGLAKIILMMAHERIPPQISLKHLNPRIRELGLDGAVIDRTGAEWPRPASGRGRIAMLNNFGAGGSNAAVLVSEYSSPSQHVKEAKSFTVMEATTKVFGFSAKSERAMAELQKRLVDYLAAANDAPNPPLLADVCATMTSRRQVYNHRVAVTAGSLTELADKIRVANIHNVADSSCGIPEAVFLFSGQGSQVRGHFHPCVSSPIHRLREFIQTFLTPFSLISPVFRHGAAAYGAV